MKIFIRKEKKNYWKCSANNRLSQLLCWVVLGAYLQLLWIGSGDRWKGPVQRLWQAVTDSDIPFLSWYTHSLCAIQSVFWPFVANMKCYNKLCECWQQSYLWFFLQSDVHPLVARQSSLLHGVMPEVIIISKNLHRHIGEAQSVHLQQQDGQITACAHQGIHVHMSKCTG